MLQVPDCSYPTDRPAATLIRPATETPTHTLYLSSLDDQETTRAFSLRYIYVYRRSLAVEDLKASLSRALVHYYPLAGRLRQMSGNGSEKLRTELECNGRGVLFVEASVEMTADRFLENSGGKPNESWKKLLHTTAVEEGYVEEGEDTLNDAPLLVIQATTLSCGGMIVCTDFKHIVIDSVGSAGFLKAWSHFATSTNASLPFTPSHNRDMLRPRDPQAVSIPLESIPFAGYSSSTTVLLLPPPRVPVSVTLTSFHVHHLKSQCHGTAKPATSFDVLAAHAWRSMVKSLDLPLDLTVMFVFTISGRKRMNPPLPDTFYGNAWTMTGAWTTVEHLLGSPLRAAVELIQEAKDRVDDEYMRSMIDLLEVTNAKADMTTTLVSTSWLKYGLEDVELGEGNMPVYVGTQGNAPCVIFQPVARDPNGSAVLLSVPEKAADKLEHYLIQGAVDPEE